VKINRSVPFFSTESSVHNPHPLSPPGPFFWCLRKGVPPFTGIFSQAPPPLFEAPSPWQISSFCVFFFRQALPKSSRVLSRRFFLDFLVALFFTLPFSCTGTSLFFPPRLPSRLFFFSSFRAIPCRFFSLVIRPSRILFPRITYPRDSTRHTPSPQGSSHKLFLIFKALYDS